MKSYPVLATYMIEILLNQESIVVTDPNIIYPDKTFPIGTDPDIILADRLFTFSQSDIKVLLLGLLAALEATNCHMEASAVSNVIVDNGIYDIKDCIHPAGKINYAKDIIASWTSLAQTERVDLLPVLVIGRHFGLDGEDMDWIDLATAEKMPYAYTLGSMVAKYYKSGGEESYRLFLEAIRQFGMTKLYNDLKHVADVAGFRIDMPWGKLALKNFYAYQFRE